MCPCNFQQESPSPCKVSAGDGEAVTANPIPRQASEQVRGEDVKKSHTATGICSVLRASHGEGRSNDSNLIPPRFACGAGSP